MSSRTKMVMARAVVGVLMAIVATGWGGLVEKGPWAGRELTPIGAADASIAEAPLAVAFVCRHGGANYEQLSRFDGWARSEASGGTPAFAVIVLENEEQRDVVEEVVTQRQLHVPTFTTTEELLNENEQTQVFLLSDGQAKKLGALEFGVLNSELGRHRTTSPPLATAAAATTSPVRVQSKNPLYVNQRYEFSVRWPRGWNYKVARSNDGAVGVAPEGSALEARVWAAPEIKSMDPSDPPPYVQIKDYLKFVKTRAVGEVQVENKLKVFDGDIEGRDYTYTYVRAGKDGQPGQKYRGRVQAFVVDGVAKLICVEGPEEEFKRSEETIDQFIYSFHPTID